jgi:hypothetical protein
VLRQLEVAKAARRKNHYPLPGRRAETLTPGAFHPLRGHRQAGSRAPFIHHDVGLQLALAIEAPIPI